MTYSTVFIFNLGLVIISYAFCLNGLNVLAFLCAAGSIYLAIRTHSIKVFYAHVYEIFFISLLELVLMQLCGLQEISSSLYTVSLAALITARLYSESSKKAIGTGMRMMDFAFIAFLILTIAIPNSTFVHLQIIAVEGMMFVPFMISFDHRRIWHVKHCMILAKKNPEEKFITTVK